MAGIPDDHGTVLFEPTPADARHSDGRLGEPIAGTIGHYRIVGPLGAGGMGVVYRAQDLALGRQVALKILPAGFSSTLQARFFREAWASARLQHPGIATFYEAGEADGIDFYAMEYVPGITLRERLREGPIPWDQACALGIGILQALAHAHAAGILHRDIKPENIMIAADHSSKLLDFGLAKPLLDVADDAEAPPAPDLNAEAAGTATAQGSAGETVLYESPTASRTPAGSPEAFLTAAGASAGTPGYMAPEQIEGKTLDGRADIFAVGAVLYEAIAGRPAFPGSTHAARVATTLRHSPAPLDAPGLSPELAAIVVRALERDPSHRHATAGAFLAELRRWCGTVPVASSNHMAILDFKELDADGDRWIGGAIAEGLIAQLGRLTGLTLLTREAAARGGASVGGSERELGLFLGCRWLLSGTSRKDGPTLHITARLTDVSTGNRLGVEELDGPVANLPAMLDRLSAAIVGHLDFDGPAHDGSGELATRLEAYRCCVLGRRLWMSQGTKGSFDEARELFERAVALDPSYALAYSNLAHLHAFRFNFIADPESMVAAVAAARLAIAADPRLAEPHIWLGYALAHQGDSVQAYDEAHRAMEMDPTNMLAPNFAAYALQQASDLGAALTLQQHLTGRADPENVHRWRRSEALAVLQTALTLSPRLSWAWIALGWAHMELDNLPEARWCFEGAVQAQGNALTAFPGAAGFLGESLRRLGDLDGARVQFLAGLEAAEKTDSMLRDTVRGVYLCGLGRAALQQGDIAAARAAFRQAILHARGRPKARCGGHLIVQALAGATRAGEGAEPFEEGLELFERREGWDFRWLWGSSDDITLLDLARAADSLGRADDAQRLLAQARQVGCTQSLRERSDV